MEFLTKNGFENRKTTMYTTEDKTMIPTIKTNDLIITKKCQPDDLNLSRHNNF